MTRLLQVMALLSALLVVPAVSQTSRLSPEDQHEFDKAYTKWVNDTRKNDRDDIGKDIRKMQEIMARNNIPANVPYDQIASPGNGYQGRSYRGQLSPQEQKEFDKYYTKWVNDTRKNDRDDIGRDVERMREIMAQNNIPADVPFEQVASTGYAPEGRYNEAPYPQNSPYPDRSRLTPEDQRDFDHYYSQWVEDSQRNDRDSADRDIRRMQDIMARNNIPSNVPYEQIATPGYPNNRYNDNYSRGAYAGTGQTRLSPEDQHDFDKAYSKWVKDSQKNDRDDLEKDTRKMQDIMARYNIPSNVPYDQIASPDAGYQH